MNDVSLPTSMPPDVADVFDDYPPDVRDKLLALRRLILDTAAMTAGVGPIEEALRWGQPSYLTSKTNSGSTIRIHTVRSSDDHYAVYFHCQTTLVETFRQMYGDLFTYSGNRAIVFHLEAAVPQDELAHCLALALRYHLDKP